MKHLELVFQCVQHYTLVTILKGQHSWTALAGVLKHCLSVYNIHFKLLSEICRKMRTNCGYEKYWWLRQEPIPFKVYVPLPWTYSLVFPQAFYPFCHSWGRGSASCCLLHYTALLVNERRKRDILMKDQRWILTQKVSELRSVLPSCEMFGNATGFSRTFVYSLLGFEVANQTPGISHVAPTSAANSVNTSRFAALGLCSLRSWCNLKKQHCQLLAGGT